MTALLVPAAGADGRRGNEIHVGADLEGMLEHGDPTDVEVQRDRTIGELPEILNELRDLELGEGVLQVDRTEPGKLHRQTRDHHRVSALRLVMAKGEYRLEHLVQWDAAGPQMDLQERQDFPDGCSPDRHAR